MVAPEIPVTAVAEEVEHEEGVECEDGRERFRENVGVRTVQGVLID